ncbi:NAD(P)-dependent oxidoreductase [uncultured Aquimarina sp.]|uniref:NAD-dependent epimerase/dehydratase family protein n=1 Tax=uncultured Aquimarina sp. TaxID=575652 RepID=UPI0026364AEB|nr:NAD(P)-dependent oxidoreductase [uncultured Aquimarina sp.]
MNKPTIIITGANGYLGENLLNHFFKLKWNIKAFVHKMPEKENPQVEYVLYDMQQDLEEDNFGGVDHVIHCAYSRYDLNSRADEINIEGVKKLIAVCEMLGIKIAFLSTFSSHSDAVSHYGVTKYKCEKLFDVSKHIIFKIGFIIGEKGILAEMIDRIDKSTFFPLVGGGKQPLQNIYIKDLCIAIEQGLTKNISGVFYLAHEEEVSMKDFYSAIAFRLNKSLKYLPVSTNLLYIACKFFEFFKIKIPVTSENVLGLKKMRTFETLECQQTLGIRYIDYKEGLDKIVLDHK